MVEPCRFLVVWGVIESPFWWWDLHRIRLGVTELAKIVLVVGHWSLNILHHDVIFTWYEVVMNSACRFGWSFIMPIDALVVA